MIASYLPWPLYGGGGIRMFNIIKELARRGHRIVLVAGQQGTSLSSDNTLKQLCEQVHSYALPTKSRLSSTIRSVFSSRPYPALKFQTPELREKVHDLLRNEYFDLIWVNFLIMADMLPERLVGNVPTVMDQIEADELLWQRYVRNGDLLQRMFSCLNLKKVQSLQKKVLKHMDAILCVSEAEANFTKSVAPVNTKVWTVPNGVDTNFFCPASAQKQDPIILTIGGMSVFRNVDATVWFTQGMFPKIKQTIPDAQFWIVGSSPDKEVLALQTIPGVVVTGEVEDVRPYYEKARVCVASFRFGEGTRLKILEAMAMGVPIVTTNAGCQGIEVVNGQHVLIANTEADFCDRVIELLHNPQRAQTIAVAARALVEQKYEWKEIVGALEPKLQQIVQKAILKERTKC